MSELPGSAGRGTAVSYRQVLANRELRGLLLAQVVSEVGDQIARVGLAALLLRESGSVLVAALTFAVTYVPPIFGSVLLGGFADRMPRKEVMVACDVARALLIILLALLAVPGVPLWLLLGLLLVAEVFTPPFDAARTALLPDVLGEPRAYLAAAGLSRTVYQLTQVVGLVAGGALAVVVSTRTGLLIDAGTFVVSGLLILATVQRRPAPQGRARAARWSTALGEAARGLAADPVRRAFVLFAWGAALFLIAPEGVALAYARNHDAPNLGGALLATIPLGAAVGMAVVSRLAPALQIRLVLPLAAAACLPLLAMASAPPVPAAMGLWLLSGICQGFMATLIGTVTLRTPQHMRGRVSGLAAGGFSLVTAAAFVLAGLLADAASPSIAVTLAGVLGLALVAGASVVWPREALTRALADTLPVEDRLRGR